MKNSASTLLVAVTLAFAAFVGGFYLGKNTVQHQIEISAYSDPTASKTNDTSLPSSSAHSTIGNTGKAEATVFPVNINTATLEQLDALPGIGKKNRPAYSGSAQRIGQVPKYRGSVGRRRHWGKETKRHQTLYHTLNVKEEHYI